METEGAPNETDGEVVVDETECEDQSPPAVQKLFGLIIAAVLIFLAQRDLRKRPPELVRGRVGVWKVVAMVPPGAVAYLLLGRRRTTPQATAEPPNSITA